MKSRKLNYLRYRSMNEELLTLIKYISSKNGINNKIELARLKRKYK